MPQSMFTPDLFPYSGWTSTSCLNSRNFFLALLFSSITAVASSPHCYINSSHPKNLSWQHYLHIYQYSVLLLHLTISPLHSNILLFAMDFMSLSFFTKTIHHDQRTSQCSISFTFIHQPYFLKSSSNNLASSLTFSYLIPHYDYRILFFSQCVKSVLSLCWS